MSLSDRYISAARPILESGLGFLQSMAAQVKAQGDRVTWKTVVASFAAYVVACRVLRFQRVRWWHWKLPYKTRADFARMTAVDAQKITNYIGAAEMSYTVVRSLQFALFRTYGIPSISRLLVKTKQLSTHENATKRYADTEVLLNEITGNAPGSERGVNALSRLNFIHSVYQNSGQISNDDMLYTLSMFALEPARWIARYEWRELTPMEVCAYGVQWKEIGDGMNISYEALPSYGKGWTDGLHWIEELKAWGQAYEEREMVPNVLNKQTADETVAMLLFTTPEMLKPIGKNVVKALMDDRLREAMMYPKPPMGYVGFIKAAFGIRAFILKNLTLPRVFHRDLTYPVDKKTGRMYRKFYEHDPWYVQPTLWQRWGPGAWLKRFSGLPVAGDGGDVYQPRGFHYTDVGPKSMFGRGATEVEEQKARLKSMGLGGCPFPGLKN